VAIKRATSSSIQNGLPNFDTVWDGVSAVGSMEAISSITLSAGQSSVEFNNIPSTYSHLQIRLSAQTNRATYGRDAIGMQFNNDTSNNYVCHNIYGDGSVVTAEYNSAASNITLRNVGTTTTGTYYFGSLIVDILDYTNIQKQKVLRFIGGVDVNGTVGGAGGTATFGSGLYFGGTVGNAANVISSIKITPGNSPFSTNSTFTLYGVK
jgi:hypothetical protein